MANTTETRSSLMGKRHDLTSPARAVEPSCMEPRQELMQLPGRESDTILEARAPSTRCLHGLKWSAFFGWCTARSLHHVSCDVSHVLSFLQELLDNRRTPSTLKVYMATISAMYSFEAGNSIGINYLNIKLLKVPRN